MSSFGAQHVLDYASARVGPVARYSGPVVVSFICALLVPLVVFEAGVGAVGAVPWWVLVGVPLAVFAMNFASAFHLLEAPNHIIGDTLVVWGVMISGLMTMLAMLVVMCTVT